ncbi:hypothetical protein PIB30_061089 [Stylosanthes scabra]|uniref:Uncharacterized protein n=1 Tax=Stylosanthes scabra TaxID=79078 RepID=A0ABU6TMX0_9FABA|nr:hypothetical protein [Stylosanthes scabra]
MDYSRSKDLGNVTIKDVHQDLSKQVIEKGYLYNQAYTPWNPPPSYPPSQNNIVDIFQALYQERKELWESQKWIAAQITTLIELITCLVTLFTVGNLTTSQPPSIHHKLPQQDQEGKKDILLNEEVHECLREVEVEHVDQEVEYEDKEPQEMEIVHSASSEATPPELSSTLHFEWVNLSDMNFLGPQHYALLEMDGQLRTLCGGVGQKGNG